ncbi:2-octaprenyl-3-methyl-6-methoxy-1,4-benzoquinol hydroxylase [Litchfieldella qijiaojingensis]|uniref:2-octaprenyl-3-methyl-6-methoxy-1,4-benzoquinol hydroxylase n=1 Tax=Litchfieldella qijiaojingensis TaxID=980347 RepID=A0ABQ2YJE9_9GAMM|nr:UbiH/UbiF/VisC/COQ6 family ubiquinone biosynthesis hydroxylase [Halomonas qijiaojingensis]GGX83981.1 2-octaprenyl-3-methyl-6-methoxy-1,4-benzoquinol hydroxylase [Halomonas qijiaojingensis]
MQAEVIVVGGGMVGATLAALLGEAGVAVQVLDARPRAVGHAAGQGRPALRVSAVTEVSRRLFAHLTVWPAMVARRVTPYTGMLVWDGQGNGEIRFAAEQAGVPTLGHIVENDVILAALETRLSELPTVEQVFDARVAELHGTGDGQRLTLEDGRTLSAPLVVAADGANSRLRELAGIEAAPRDTGHQAVVTTVRVGHSHAGVARQVFLPSGPLAFLPLTVDGEDRYCSIVWSTSPHEAERLTRLSAEGLAAELEAAFEGRLGSVEVIDKAVDFPLAQRHAARYVAPGLALIGDAAHSIHPLAGQGVNLGLMDAAVLAEELVSARSRGGCQGDMRVLSRYARRRRGDNAAMLALMDGFRLLFGVRHPAWQLARNLGLSGVDRLTPLKRLMIRQAIGERGRLPASCR